MFSRSDLLRAGRGLLLDLVDRAEVRDAAAAWMGQDHDATSLVLALGTWFGQPA